MEGGEGDREAVRVKLAMRLANSLLASLFIVFLKNMLK